MKFWAYVCRTQGDLAYLEGPLPLPLLNMDTIEEPRGIKLTYLKDIWNSSSENMESNYITDDVLSDKVRFTCLLRRDHVEKLKK